jgi:hypothetical protein
MPVERPQTHGNNCAGYLNSAETALIGVFYPDSGDIEGSVRPYGVVVLQRQNGEIQATR